MKRRGGGRRDRADRFPSQPFSGDDAFRAAHLHGVRILEPPPDKRTRQIHHLVVVSFFADWCGHWLGHVSILSLIEHYFDGWIARNLVRLLSSKRLCRLHGGGVRKQMVVDPGRENGHFHHVEIHTSHGNRACSPGWLWPLPPFTELIVFLVNIEPI